MSGLRFKVGELALFVFATDPSGIGSEMETVEIHAVGPFKTGDRITIYGRTLPIRGRGDYVIRYVGTTAGGLVKDYQLRKIDPPAEPASLTRTKECEVAA